MMKLVFHPSHLPPQPLCFNYMYIDTRGVTWRKDLWICSTSFLFLRFWIPVYKPGLLNLQIVPWTLSKHNNHSSSHKNKKDSRQSRRRADWFSCPGMKYTSALFLNLVIVWLCSTLSLPGDFAHHGTEAEGTSIWVLTSKRGSGELISDRRKGSWEGHLWSLPAQHLCPLSLAWLTSGETFPSVLSPCDSINTDHICWLWAGAHDLGQAYQSRLVLRFLRLLGNKALFYWEMNFSLSWGVFGC